MEENAKVKGTRKVRAAGKKKKGRRLRRLCPPQFPLFIFWCSHFLNSADPVSGPDLEAWNTVVKASPANSMLTIVNPESDAHPSFVNVVTMPLNMANAGKMLSVALPRVHNTVNGR